MSDLAEQRQALEAMGDIDFQDTYRGLTPENQTALGPDVRARYKKLTPYVTTGSLVERARAALGLLDAKKEPITTVQLVCGGDIQPEAIGWLWKNYLARGKLHLLAGAPGTGKTTMALAIASTITQGGRWPDGTKAEQGNVLIWSGEDDIKDTLLPRLIAHRVDRKRVHFVGDVAAAGSIVPFDPAKHLEALTQAAAAIGNVSLLIVDPIVNAVQGDSHKTTEVRRALQPIVNLAQSLDAAALGISHFAKGTQGRDPVERITGSGAFGALPRIIFAAAKDQEGKRILVRTKSNIGPDGGGFRYDFEQTELTMYPGIFASRVLWGEPLEGTAKELLAIAEVDENDNERGVKDECTDWLRELIRECGGELDKREVFKAARDNGYSERTVYRARDRLRCKVRTSGFGTNKRSKWTLAADSSNPASPATPQKYGKNDDIGNIGRNDEAPSNIANPAITASPANLSGHGSGGINGDHEAIRASAVSLIHRVADREGFTPEDRAEELAKAATDPVGQLATFRTLVAQPQECPL